jgi:hypothetical protein
VGDQELYWSDGKAYGGYVLVTDNFDTNEEAVEYLIENLTKKENATPTVIAYNGELDDSTGVDAADASVLIDVLQGNDNLSKYSAKQLLECDVNADGQVTVADIVELYTKIG